MNNIILIDKIKRILTTNVNAARGNLKRLNFGQVEIELEFIEIELKEILKELECLHLKS